MQYSCVFVARKKIPVEIILYDSSIGFYFLSKTFFSYTFHQVLKLLTFKKKNLVKKLIYTQKRRSLDGRMFTIDQYFDALIAYLLIYLPIYIMIKNEYLCISLLWVIIEYLNI